MRKTLLLTAFLSAAVGANAQNIARNCYRGYVDAGYSIDIGDYDFGRVEVNTSHGYQFNPYFFLGAGVGLHFMPSYQTKGMDIPLDVRESKADIPVFANLRYNFSKKKVAPFVDLKAGSYVNNNGGLYANVSAGCRVALNEKQAISLSVGYSNEKLEFEIFHRYTSDYSLDYTRKPTLYETEAVTLKLGFEF